MNRAAALTVLKAVADRTFRSLPPEVRKTLNGVAVRLEHLGRAPNGRKGLGWARDDGRLVLLDERTVLRYAEDQEVLEDLLAHELSHCYRALQGLSGEPGEADEAETDRLARKWGFRAKGGPHVR